MAFYEEVIAVSETRSNKQTDADILRCKGDILRARDVIPGAGKHEPEAQSKQIKPGKNIRGSPIDNGQKKAEIPRFDLAEEIMAEQRKITAIRRKAPGEKTGAKGQEPVVESIGYTIRQPTSPLSEQEEIIAEIVARDIERLRQGGTLGRFGVQSGSN